MVIVPDRSDMPDSGGGYALIWSHKGGEIVMPQQDETPKEKDVDQAKEKDVDQAVEKGATDRRKFLKASAAAGVGALGLASITLNGSAGQTRVQQSSATILPSATPLPSITPPPLTSTSSQPENWGEPMVWRVGDWIGQQLDLNAVYHSAPLAVLGFSPFAPNANPNLNPDGTDLLFSFSGIAPGPTVRMRGDETFYLKLRNLLPLNAGTSDVPFPDDSYEDGFFTLEIDDWCLGEHLNGVHSTHTTNIHTHGLHVRPGQNPDGPHSDNIYLRIIPLADWAKRQASDDPKCNFLQDFELVAQADYEFRLGNVGAFMADPRWMADPKNAAIAKALKYDTADAGFAPYPHPDGTFWYHPHPHGATFWQVTAGMAGFLIVEGVTDDAIRRALAPPPPTGTPDSAEESPFYAVPSNDSELPYGPYNFRERLMFLQRIKVKASGGVDPDAPKPGKRSVNNTAFQPIVNGTTQILNITMTPKTVERWRFLNGGVDAYGYFQIYILKGDWQTIQFAGDTETNSPSYGQLTADPYDAENPTKLQLPVTDEQLAPSAVPYYLLAFDGITLVNDPNAYVSSDGTVNHRYMNPITNDLTDMGDVRYTFQKIDIANGDAAVILAVANRADVLFKAPDVPDGETDVYTIVARNWGLVSDKIASSICTSATGEPSGVGSGTFPADTVLARVYVSNSSSGDEPSEDPLQLIFDDLASDKSPVQPYLRPVLDEELELSEAEKSIRYKPEPTNEGKLTKLKGPWYRKRLVTYSGWGGGYPAQGSIRNPLPNLPTKGDNAPNQADYTPVKISPLLTATHTMAIDGFKFNPDLSVHTMNLNTAEEWVLQNCSMVLFGDTSQNNIDPRVGGGFGPKDQQFQSSEAFLVRDASGPTPETGTPLYPVKNAVDHPFHIHQNPIWITEVWVAKANADAETGEVTLEKIANWKPRWQDVVHIPRNGGRVVFRSRFWDFLGRYVNHCHLLLHEDNGMMEPIEVIDEGGSRPIDQGDSPNVITKEDPLTRGIEYNIDGSVEQVIGNLANYAVAPFIGLTDTGDNRDKKNWSSPPDQHVVTLIQSPTNQPDSTDNIALDVWPQVSSRLDCFKQNQTALDTNRLPVNPIVGRSKFPEQQQQGLGNIEDFAEATVPVPTPTITPTPSPTPEPTSTP